MINKSDLYVGMPVYISSRSVGSRRKTEFVEARISKIGRKWIEVEPVYLGRFSIEDGEDAGECTPVRRLYSSPDEYFNVVDRNRLIMELIRMDKRLVENILTPQLEQVAELLGLTYEKVDRLSNKEIGGLGMNWISVEERLPGAPGHYLVLTSINYWHGGCDDVNSELSNLGTTKGYVGTRKSVLDCYYDISGDWNRVCNQHVTHWMSIPAPPTVGVDEESETLEPDTEAVESCPYCEAENVYPGWDVEKHGYIAECKECGKRIFLCDECLHAEDNPSMHCDWHNESNGECVVGYCFRGITANKE